MSISSRRESSYRDRATLSMNLASRMSFFDSPPQSCVDNVIWTWKKARNSVLIFQNIHLQIIRGVPQGSVSGPLLFINHADVITINASFHFSADETVTSSIRSIENSPAAALIRTGLPSAYRTVSWFTKPLLLISKENFHYRSSGLFPSARSAFLYFTRPDVKCELARYVVRLFAVQTWHFQRPDVCGLSCTLNTVYSC